MRRSTASKVDVVDEIMPLTGSSGVDAFEQALRVRKPGGTLSSLGEHATEPSR